MIAGRYHTTVATLRAANDIAGNMIRAGDSLLIPVASRSPDAYDLSEEERLKTTRDYVRRRMGSEPTNYEVAAGDTLWELSRRFNVPMRALARWNGMATTDVLHPGTTLMIFTSKPVQVAERPATNEVIRKVNYRVRRGESLSVIASKFNLTVADIRKWNGEVSRQKYLQPGDRITLYVDVTRTQ